MTISRKVEKVIEAGGSVKTTGNKYKILTQKVRADVLKDVDAAVLERPWMNRNAWIQEAIHEKLKRLKDVHQN